MTASALVTICALAATALILRVLPRAEAGRFALLVELLYALGVLGSLGQATLQARLYQQAAPGHFDWWRDLRSTIAITFPAILLAVLAIAIPYSLTSFEIVFICAGSELFVLINCLSAVLAQQQRYAWSSALLRLPNGLLIVPVGLMMIHRSWLNLHFILLCFLFLLFLTVLLSVWLLGRRLERGRAAITLKQRLPGFTFLIAIVAIIATQRGMITVAGAILTPERIAALAALIVLLRVFDLVWRTGWSRFLHGNGARSARHYSRIAGHALAVGGNSFRIAARRASSRGATFLCGPLRCRVAAFAMAGCGGRIAICRSRSARIRVLFSADQVITLVRCRAICRRHRRPRAHGKMDAGL